MRRAPCVADLDAVVEPAGARWVRESLVFEEQEQILTRDHTVAHGDELRADKSFSILLRLRECFGKILVAPIDVGLWVVNPLYSGHDSASMQMVGRGSSGK